MSGALRLTALHPWGRQLGPVAFVSRARVVWVWGPSTSPTACALVSWLWALRGWREGVPWGGALRRREGGLRSGGCPPQAARPRGQQLWSAAHVLWAWVCGRGGPALSLWRASLAGCCASLGWQKVALGGRNCHRCEGRLVSGALPLPAARRWGRQLGPVALVSRACVVWVWGPSTGPTACALASWRCALWGWRGVVPREVPRAVMRGV